MTSDLKSNSIFYNYHFLICFFCFILWLNVTFKHLRSYRDSGALTNVLPHRNAILQTQDMTPHPVTVYRDGADLSLYYPLMWNVTLEYTATHFDILGQTRPGNRSPTFHVHQRTLDFIMLIWWQLVGSLVEGTVITDQGPVVCESITLSARPLLLLYHFLITQTLLL